MAERIDGQQSCDGVLQWEDLPAEVRTAAVDAAARILGSVDAGQIPAALMQVARFTPAKRAKRGSVPLAKALDEDASFRAMVAVRLPASFGADPADPVRACARAFIVRLPHSQDLLAAAVRADTLTELRERIVDLTATVESLLGQLGAAEAVLPPSAVNDEALASGATARAEIDKLRARLRLQGTRMREIEDQAHGRIAEAETARNEAAARLEREQAHTTKWEQKLAQESRRADLAQEALERQRAHVTQTRLDADRRMSLLLDTVIDAAAGLKREWRLATGGADPAEVVVRDYANPGPRPMRPVDAALLLQWLKLPGAHLIVDGYNVTKTGYGELSLAHQRDRLTRSLTTLATRTGAEVTVVFDGAAVVVPTSSTREVRVVFSPPGIIADDVIRDMAAAEPIGRVVVVVSSDREVADSVRRTGARVAASAVLLSALA
ncbi:MAG: NYN domain-containing protein [Nakamurella sp.]